MNQENVKQLIADNITYYRKKAGMTQAELAEKINYSDKAVSKWERGEGVPDVYVLCVMAEIFGITLNDFTAEPLKRKISVIKRNKIVISLLSVGVAWLLATLAFVLISIVAPQFPYKHMPFIYAMPVSAIVLIVFSAIWGYKLVLLLSESALIWTLILSLYTSLTFLTNAEYLFFLGIPVQVLAVIWFLLKKRKKYRP